MKKSYLQLLICYLLWGFQPFYWNRLEGIDNFTILAFRIIFAAIFSLIILAVQNRLPELKALFRNKQIMKRLIPAVFFLFGDWAIFIVAVRNGHVLDVSLGYYINPLILFAIGLVVYKEKSTKAQVLALIVAAAGVIISTISYGQIPLLSLAVACDWAVYASIKKDVKIDGVLSIAAETLMLSLTALVFLIAFRMPELGTLSGNTWLFIVGSGIVTALPMYLYSNAVSVLPLAAMCFAQYLSPTFNLICGLMMGESFSKSQLISLAFFVVAIIIFTVSEFKKTNNNFVDAQQQNT